MTAVAFQDTMMQLSIFGPLEFVRPLDLEDFTKIAEQLPDLKMERDKDGKSRIMSPIKKGSAKQEAEAMGQLYRWYYDHQRGELYSPSTGVFLPDGQVRSPDCAWLSDERIDANPTCQDDEFLNIVPDFVMEIKSHTDSIKKLRQKMEEVWMENGVALGWLMDVNQETVYMYEQGKPEPTQIIGYKGRLLSADPVLPGFAMELERFLPKRKG